MQSSLCPTATVLTKAAVADGGTTDRANAVPNRCLRVMRERHTDQGPLQANLQQTYWILASANCLQGNEGKLRAIDSRCFNMASASLECQGRY